MPNTYIIILYMHTCTITGLARQKISRLGGDVAQWTRDASPDTDRLAPPRFISSTGSPDCIPLNGVRKLRIQKPTAGEIQ